MLYKKCLALLIFSSFSICAFAHTALMACFDEGNDYILCEGGFSDGASAEGIEFRVEQNNTVIMQTRMDEFGEVYFKKPQGNFTVVLNAGEGHVVHVNGKDITE